jgi:hypothetical protein
VASADGTSVYVALRSSSAVSTIDTTALKQTGLITGFPCATDVALAGAQLFVSYGCDAGAIARVDTTTEDAPVAVDESMSWYAPPRLAATAGRLVAVQQDANPADLVSYAVAGTEVTRGATVQVDSGDTLAESRTAPASPPAATPRTASGCWTRARSRRPPPCRPARTPVTWRSRGRAGCSPRA